MDGQRRAALDPDVDLMPTFLDLFGCRAAGSACCVPSCRCSSAMQAGESAFRNVGGRSADRRPLTYDLYPKTRTRPDCTKHRDAEHLELASHRRDEDHAIRAAVRFHQGNAGVRHRRVEGARRIPIHDGRSSIRRGPYAHDIATTRQARQSADAGSSARSRGNRESGDPWTRRRNLHAPTGVGSPA